MVRYRNWNFLYTRKSSTNYQADKSASFLVEIIKFYHFPLTIFLNGYDPWRMFRIRWKYRLYFRELEGILLLLMIERGMYVYDRFSNGLLIYCQFAIVTYKLIYIFQTQIVWKWNLYKHCANFLAKSYKKANISLEKRRN